MSKALGPTPLVEVLAPSIKDDPTIRAAAGAADAALLPIVRAIPRMLLWARLWQDESRLSPSLRRIVQFCGGLPPLSDEELELLAWQMHVDFWSPAWPRQIREDLVKHSTAWHRLKGTPAGVVQALSLFGIEAVIEEDGSGEDWATWQLGLLSGNVVLDFPEVAADQSPLPMVARLAYKVAVEMQPQRCRLFRIHNEEYDFRPIILTDGPPLSEGFLTFYSGAQDDADGPVISLGDRYLAQTDTYAPQASAGAGVQTGLSALAPYIDMFILGHSRIGDDFPVNHSFVVAEVVGLSLPDPEPSWWLMYQAPTSRSQISLSDHEADERYGDCLGGMNCCLGVPTATVWEHPFVLGESRLSDHDHGLRHLLLHELFRETLSFQAEALAPVQP